MKVVIDIPQEYINLCPEYYQGDLVLSQICHAVKHGTLLEDIRSKILYEIYMDGVNMANEYHGCWVRFKNIETIVNRYMRERSEE